MLDELPQCVATQAQRARDVACARLRIGSEQAVAVVRQWLGELDAQPDVPRSYAALPRSFIDAIGSATIERGEAGPSAWLDLLLVELVLQFGARFSRAGLPEALLPDYTENIQRMLERVTAGCDWARAADDDIFVKDLGILRMTLIPCASHLVFRNSGVPRRLVIGQNPPTTLRALEFFLRRCGGFAPFMENHVHPAMLTHFNPQGRERCYRLVAELLRRWPDSRGLMGLSWYYDPAVAGISPRLAYLREVPLRAGAFFLAAGSDAGVVRGATVKSPTRRRLYDAGSYRPTRYLMAWARGDLLDYCGG